MFTFKSLTLESIDQYLFPEKEMTSYASHHTALKNNPRGASICVSNHLVAVNAINSQMQSCPSSIILMKLFSHEKNKCDFKSD